jgi:alpha 1,3-mannosyltransferase
MIVSSTRVNRPYRQKKLLFFVICVLLFVNLIFIYPRLFQLLQFTKPPPWNNSISAEVIRKTIIQDSGHFLTNPVSETAFGEMGIRTEKIYTWLDQADKLRIHLTSKQHASLQNHLERVVIATFPFLMKENEDASTAVSRLRRGMIPGSKGIVITAGKDHFRYLCHLLGNLLTVIKTPLPVEVAYAGDEDLPQSYRDALKKLFPSVETFDILQAFDDRLLDLGHGTWAAKPFAILASRFEQVIGLDADAVFLQDPNTILSAEESAFAEPGVLLYHDRLLWQGAFKERHEWWHQEMANANRIPSDTLNSSKVWSEHYAEEADSGVVVFDKSRLPVLFGLLHVAWQNTKAVRETLTYTITYGDKESWWFGLELSGVPFAFEKHYGSMIGTLQPQSQDGSVEAMVCSFTIAHLDSKDRLLWYNGSLLKNKLLNGTEFLIPDAWMMDGTWLKGATKQDESCMKGREVKSVSGTTLDVLRHTVEEAQRIDALLETMAAGQ